MVPLARKNLFHDKIRLIIAVAGVAVAVALVLYNIGVLVYAMNNAGKYIEKVEAGIWVMKPGADSLPERSTITKARTRSRQITRLPGVTGVSELVVADMQAHPRQDKDSPFSVTLVGFDSQSGRGGPWKLRPGAMATTPDRQQIILDEQVAENNGIAVGEVITIKGLDLQVIALSEETSTLSEQMGFVTLPQAQQITGSDESSYLLVTTATQPAVKDNTDFKRGPVWSCPLCTNIEETTGLQALAATEFYENSVNQWMEWMGIWMFGMCAVILCVAMVVVLLTIYTATVERLPEFGLLKAIGASNGYIAFTVVKQALTGTSLGYGAGLLLTVGFVALMARVAPDLAVVDLSLSLIVSVFVIVLALSVAAALLAVNKAIRVDPLIVFRSR
jgi:putative ABC transport system permease protein